MNSTKKRKKPPTQQDFKDWGRAGGYMKALRNKLRKEGKLVEGSDENGEVVDKVDS